MDAAAILLSWQTNRTKSLNASGRPITEPDINNKESSANLEIKLERDGSFYGWNIAKVRKGYRKKDIVSVLVSATEAAKQIQSEITEAKGKVNLPLFAYYPVNRAVLDIPLRIREKHRFDPISTYDESLTGGANFRTFFEWFREREDLENENRRYVNDLVKPEGFQFPDSQLEAVRRALEKLMPEFKNLTVRRNPLRMEVEKNGEKLTVNQLSDGEKCLMALVGDLARRMAIANPLHENPLEGEGVVLIDEICLHLHPRWQQIVIPGLLDAFSYCQFLVTTHSPHVTTHVQPESLFLLDMTDQGLTAIRPLESYGKTAERVLKDLMGLDTTRPTDIENAIKNIYEQIDSGNLKQAHSSINELAEQIGGDPELVKAKVLIKRKELIGK